MLAIKENIFTYDPSITKAWKSLVTACGADCGQHSWSCPLLCCFVLLSLGRGEGGHGFLEASMTGENEEVNKATSNHSARLWSASKTI